MFFLWLCGNISVYVYMCLFTWTCVQMHGLLLYVSVYLCVVYCLPEGGISLRDPEPELQRPAVCELILTV